MSAIDDLVARADAEGLRVAPILAAMERASRAFYAERRIPVPNVFRTPELYSLALRRYDEDLFLERLSAARREYAKLERKKYEIHE